MPSSLDPLLVQLTALESSLAELHQQLSGPQPASPRLVEQTRHQARAVSHELAIFHKMMEKSGYLEKTSPSPVPVPP